MALKKLSPETLRKHKGISFTGITTVFFCHDGKGHLFLAKRSAQTRDEHGRWDPGAGGLKHGQAVQDNMLRELKEEYGVDPIKTEFIGYRDVFRKTPEGQTTHWLSMDFAVQVDPEKVRICEPEMVDDSGWFALDELPTPLHSQFGNFLKLHGDKLRAAMTL